MSMRSSAYSGLVRRKTLVAWRAAEKSIVPFSSGTCVFQVQARDLSGRRRVPPPKPSSSSSAKNVLGKLGTVGLAGSFLLGKGKYVLGGLKLFKATPLLSMVFTSFTYSLFFGWPYAVGMVGQVLLHEVGHLVVLRSYGIPFSPMVMIPFMGAGIQMEGHPRNAWQEAMVAFGGPVAGGATAFGVMAAANAMDSQLLYSLADFGFMINLFNLLPINPLDGGRVANAISPWLSGAGVAGGIAMAANGMVGNPIFYLVLMAGAYDTASRAMGWSTKPRGYYQIGQGRQVALLAGLIALISTLLVGMRLNDRKRKTPKQLEREKRYGSDPNAAPWANDPDAVYDDFFDDNGGPRSGSF